jgi:Domain of unknown function (DUF4331)
MRKRIAAVVAATVTVVSALGLLLAGNPLTSGAADHLDAPTVKADGRIDITDIYAFHGRDRGHSVLVMDVNPLTTPADTAGLTFSDTALYQFRVDSDGDAVENYAYQLRFGAPNAHGAQRMWLYRASGDLARAGRPGRLLASGWTSVGGAVRVTRVGSGGKLFAGPRDDPFFFDLAGFKNNLKFTGADTFAGTNISAIVLEVPNHALGGKVGIWGTVNTPVAGPGHRSVQVERMGRPAINTVFNHTDVDKENFNRDIPSRDRSHWSKNVVDTEVALGQTRAYGRKIAKLLLPDVLTYDTANPGTFVPGLNGRALADDVIDLELTVVSNGAITTDKVDANDKPFLGSFPYLAAPH